MTDGAISIVSIMCEGLAQSPHTNLLRCLRMRGVGPMHCLYSGEFWRNVWIKEAVTN